MTGTQPTPPNWNAPPQWVPPQPQRRARSGVRVFLVLLLALVAAGAIVIAALIWAGRQQEPEPRTITPVPNDVCGFIGAGALRQAIPGAKLTSRPAGLSLSATCEAVNSETEVKAEVEVTRYDDAGHISAETRARQLFTSSCEENAGKWQPVDPDDTTPPFPSPVPAPDLGHPLCGKPGLFTEMTILQDYTVVTIRFSGGSTRAEWDTFADKATGLAEHTLQRLETLK